jgi:hypothetical protein
MGHVKHLVTVFAQLLGAGVGENFAKSGDNQRQFTSWRTVIMKGNVAAIVLVSVGTFFLLSNLGLINISLAELLKTWWPLILIAVGVSLFFTNKGSR